MFSESDYSSSTTSDDCYLSSDNNFKNNLTSFHDENEVTIKQFVHDVIDFSSQYGSDLSISYTAYNLTGKPSKFPDYGDFPETYAMRTYGQWWDHAPSGTKEIMPQNSSNNIPINDFIVINFTDFVYPTEVQVFETYNPGSIVKIWAFTITEKWILLWQGQTQYIERKSKIFSPSIKKINEPTRILRLEFNHSKLDYFTELDALMLIGRKFNVKLMEDFVGSKDKKGLITKKLEKVKFKPQILENNHEIFSDFLKNDLEKFEEQAGLFIPDDKKSNQLTLNNLPSEILFNIFSYLDLISLFRVAEVSKNLYDSATDSLLYKEISLKTYWDCSNSNLIETLTKRGRLLKKLDLSWNGLFNTISTKSFNDLIKNCGNNLTHLRLNCCSFLNVTSINEIGLICTNLKELSIRNFHGDNLYFHGLVFLRKLERLDLFRSIEDSNFILNILKNNPNMKHLNLGFCSLNVNMDQIAVHISKYNKKIISIDMWKSHHLTSIGLKALSECHQLEEIDIGWCMREESQPGESLKLLLKGCPKLKKLFLARIRGLNDRDLDNIANFCPNLEQLDLMGIMGISTEMCYNILLKCNNLMLFDVSFCDQLDELQIALWREIFGVNIKRSYVPSDFFIN